jgi:hypothetical protein
MGYYGYNNNYELVEYISGTEYLKREKEQIEEILSYKHKILYVRQVDILLYKFLNNYHFKQELEFKKFLLQ